MVKQLEWPFLVVCVHAVGVVVVVVVAAAVVVVVVVVVVDIAVDMGNDAQHNDSYCIVVGWVEGRTVVIFGCVVVVVLMVFDGAHNVVFGVVVVHISVDYNLVSSFVIDLTMINTLKPIIRKDGSIVG